MKRISIAIAAGLGSILVVVVVRALMLPTVEPWLGLPPAPAIDEAPIARHLSEAIRYRTLSKQEGDVDPEPFEDFIAWMTSAYPALHDALERERVADYSLLYTWRGSNPALDPILLTAHYDVVPVIPGSEADWTHPPFEGVVADGFVWGRGSLDDKSGVVAMLEAVTLLLEEGFAPERTIHLSFGHDEEVGGNRGAAGVTELLRSRGVTLEWSLDEGSFVIEGIFPGVEAPLAMISVAEKGYVTLELVAKGRGGHSSMPPRQTAVGVLAEAILALEQNQMPGGLDGNTGQLMEALAPHVPFLFRLVLANQWLFGGIIEVAVSDMQTANAMMRTTTAATMLSGSVKENVLPIEAVGVVNFRVHPRDTVDDVVAHVERQVSDERIEIRVLGQGSDPSEVSSSESEGWRQLTEAVRDAYGAVVIAPGVTVGGTDSRHYGQIAKDAYRFNPMLVTSDEISGFHGTNERISLDGLLRGVSVYMKLMRAAAGPEAGEEAR